MQFWSWECDEAFDATMVINIALEQQHQAVKWVDFIGNLTKVSGWQ
jgi:hypothetical protein